MPRPHPKSHLILAFLPYTCAIVGPLLATLGLVGPRTGFFIFLGAALFGVVDAAMGLYFILRGRFFPAVVMGVGILPLLGLLGFVSMSGNAPLINDITTDFDNPVAFVMAPQAPENEGKDLSYPAEFEGLQQQAYPDLKAVVLGETTPERALAHVKSIVEEMADTEVVYRGENVLEATQTSGLFKFVDDFVIRADEVEGGTRIDIRSRSRLGKGDFGANARRIEAIYAKLRNG